MSDLDEDFDDIPPLLSKTIRHLNQLRAAGETITISINGQVNLPVKDDESYDLLVNLVDRLELIEILRERLAHLNAGGPTFSLDEVKERARVKYGITL